MVATVHVVLVLPRTGTFDASKNGEYCMKVREIYRCRFCGKLLFEVSEGVHGYGPFMRTTAEWMFKEPEDMTIPYRGVADEQFDKTILHRCNTSTISVCDFVGIDKVFADEEHEQEVVNDDRDGKA